MNTFNHSIRAYLKKYNDFNKKRTFKKPKLFTKFTFKVYIPINSRSTTVAFWGMLAEMYKGMLSMSTRCCALINQQDLKRPSRQQPYW